MTDTQLLVVAGIAAGISIAGLTAAMIALVDAVKEFQHSRTLNQGAFLYARATLRSQCFRIVKLLTLIMIATLVIIDYEPRRLIATGGFLLIIILTTLDSTLDGFVSHRIKRYLTNKLTDKDRRK